MQNYLDTYINIRKKVKAYGYIQFLVGWDAETVAPKGGTQYRSKQMEVIAEEAYKYAADPQYVEAIEKLYENLDQLDEDMKVEIKKQFKELRIIKKVPKDEYIAFQVLTASSSQIWAEAKQKNDFSIYQPTLEKIVEFNRKLVKYLETPELKGYDILLDMFEEGFTTKEYDYFFEYLQKELVPFVMEVTSRPKEKFNRRLSKAVYPKDQQAKFSHYLLDVFGYNQNYGTLQESEHPFTSGVSIFDTRITTHYHEDNLASSIFSTIHELGHALYEMQGNEKFEDTFINGGSSLGMHESQSRLYENMIGRSLSFWQTHYNKLVELFPKQLKDISVEEFVKYINQAKRSLIRIEADELTYALHVMVRYELEKGMISGKIKVKDLPNKWKQLMSKYVGKRPKTDQEGVLQDVHWSFGAIGYFPTYALGSAYAAQIYDAMDKEINVEKAILDNDILKINAWLKSKIHIYSGSKTPKELMMIATGIPFDPQYYVNYLKQKFNE
jgi:carboxypeptidase Taq